MGHLRLFLDAVSDVKVDNLDLKIWLWSGEFMSQRYLIAVERAVRPQLAYVPQQLPHKQLRNKKVWMDGLIIKTNDSEDIKDMIVFFHSTGTGLANIR